MKQKNFYLKLKKFSGETLIILKLGFPLIISHLLMTMIEFVDSLMAGNISSIDLAGLAIGSAIYHPVFLLVLGILIPLGSIIAQLIGEGKKDEVVKNTIHGLCLSQILALLSVMILINVEPLLNMVGYEKEVIKIATDYLGVLCYGLPAIYAFIVLRMFTEGLAITRPTMYFVTIGLGIKVILNYFLMFGKYGSPSLGTVGAGYSTSITQWIMLIMFLIFCAKSKLFNCYRKLLLPRMLSWLYFREILRIGLPHGFGLVAETGLFTSISLLMATFGVTAIAGHQIAINVASLTFMIPMGLSIAISIRVGQAKGKCSFKETQYIGRLGIFICFFLMSLSALVFVLIPDLIAKIYTDDMNVKDQAVKLLIIAAIFQMSDGVQVGALGALRGLKDTKVPFVTNVISYWGIGLPAAYIVGINFKVGPEGLWVGLIIGLSVAAILHCWRFNIITKRLI